VNKRRTRLRELSASIAEQPVPLHVWQRSKPASRVIAALAILVALVPLSCGARTGDLSAYETREVVADASIVPDAGEPSDASVCDHPAIPMYTCSPLPLNEGTCPGGPGALTADASYVNGCKATLPLCDPNAPASPLVCLCTTLQMAPIWICGF
jgi:hypothetical protein